MNIVVTGALGHIGSRLIRDLPASLPGCEILMVDDLSTQRYCSLVGLPEAGRYQFVETDVLTADLTSIVEGSDVVIHLAAVTNATESFAAAERVERVNLRGTEQVARACASVGAPMVFLSTTSVYGKQSGAVDEDCPESQLQPQSPYATSKLKAERLLEELGGSLGLRFVICRFGTIFGTSPGMRFHTAVNKFCWQAVMGLPLTVWRTALHQERPYLDLDDAVASIVHILRRGLFDGRVYNVLTTNASVGQIVDLISVCVPDVGVKYVDAEIMNQLSYRVLGRRFEATGFRHRGDMERGIRATVQWLGGDRRRGPWISVG
jgi:nucleoside-diphosphate-sugar epimerase